MADEDSIYFEPTSMATPPCTQARHASNSNSNSTSISTAKPPDDLTAPPPSPNTIFYLTTTTPHLDTWMLHGPAPSFAALLPQITTTTSTSPPAISKLEALSQDPSFAGRGFTTFVVDGQRAHIYAVLRVVRSVDPAVCALLPAPVYVVTAHGPLCHAVGADRRTVRGGRPSGMAGGSRLVGAYCDAGSAVREARGAMDGLLRGGGGGNVHRTERIEMGGMGRGVIMAMEGGRAWEVRISYEDDATRWAGERVGADGEVKRGFWRGSG